MIRKLIRHLKESPSFWQTLANYTEKLWGFAYSLILARIILPESFGVFALGTSIAQLAAILTRWEVGNLVRSDSYYRKEGFELVWGLSKKLALAEIGVIVMISGVCAALGMQQGLYITILVYGFANALDKLPLLLKSDLEGRSCFRHNFTVKLLFPPATALITIPMAMMGFELWALLASTWVGVSLNWIVFRKANRRPLPSAPFSADLLKKVVKPSLWQWLNYLCYTILYRADKVLVGSVQSSQSVAYYNRAYNYAPLSYMALGAIAGVPAIVAFSKLENYRAKWKVFAQRAGLLIGAGLLNGVVWILWADELVVFLFGSNWEFAVPYFKIFAFFGSVQGLYFLAGSIMQGSKKYKMQGLITLSSIVVASVSFLFIPLSGIAVAIVLQVTMVVAALGMVLYLFISNRAGYFSEV